MKKLPIWQQFEGVSQASGAKQEFNFTIIRLPESWEDDRIHLNVCFSSVYSYRLQEVQLQLFWHHFTSEFLFEISLKWSNSLQLYRRPTQARCSCCIYSICCSLWLWNADFFRLGCAAGRVSLMCKVVLHADIRWTWVQWHIFLRFAALIGPDTPRWHLARTIDYSITPVSRW